MAIYRYTNNRGAGFCFDSDKHGEEMLRTYINRHKKGMGVLELVKE